ncbi:MAG: ComF family protein [Parcubacteria group bacterium]|nr:ComF family protein [Parcubacteria group bacterium]
MPHRFFNFLLDLFFPWTCLYCHQEVINDYPLCDHCFKQIPVATDFICPHCHKLLIPETKHYSCSRYTKLDALGSVSSYGNQILRETIHWFKYNKIISLRKPLALLMIKFLEQSFYFSQIGKEDLIIIPLPLHQKKKKQRGFNQSELLAQDIADHFYLSCDKNILIRIKNNSAQVNIVDSAQRKLNVANIFQVNNNQNLYNKTILLIDDVYTTGATLNEAAKTLKKAGAKKVIGLVLAKG